MEKKQAPQAPRPQPQPQKIWPSKIEGHPSCRNRTNNPPAPKKV
jgi:hypothetical protein